MSTALRGSPPASSAGDTAAPRHRRGAAAALSGGLTAVVGSSGLAIGLAAVFGTALRVHVAWLIPLVGIELHLDPLGGFFVSATGAVVLVVGIYTVGYAAREHLPRFALAALPVFALGMMLVPAAGSVTTFLVAWELMALASLVLVLSEHHRPAVRSAGVFYAVMTQLGFAAILLGLMVLSAGGHADGFAAISVHAQDLSAGTRTAAFLLTLIGFGSKAGLLPLHAWLPRAHPEAPSPVSALMSAAMVNMGIYGIIRVDLQVLGPAPRWWGLTLLIVGAISAVYGVLQASVATDLKRVLAYSTTENMGLITVALGAAVLLYASAAPSVAAIALTAAMLHLLGHAAFKTLGFLAAGSVLSATGLRDLDRLGGLARPMPATTVLFGVAALGASGLPLGAGFVSEWLLLQSLIHAPNNGDTVLALAMPLSVGAVALTTGLGVAAMVKAFGAGFLARPRSPAAADARESPATMLTGMALAALACATLAVAPILVGPALRRALATLPDAGGTAGPPQLDAVLRLPGLAGTISPALLAAGAVVAVLLAVIVSRWGIRHRPPSAAAPVWACGADRLSARMQYTATSFAEPLQRVFDDVLRPDTDLEITHFVESQYLVAKVAYRTRLTDSIEDRLYQPVLGAVAAWASWVRRAHNASVHLYLAYGGLGLLIVLLVAR